jgi:hypothetical protein
MSAIPLFGPVSGAETAITLDVEYVHLARPVPKNGIRAI